MKRSAEGMGEEPAVGAGGEGPGRKGVPGPPLA